MTVPALAEELQVHFLAQIARGIEVTTAAQRCGTTKRRIQAMVETDEDFRDAYFEAIDIADDRVVHTLYNKAVDGEFQSMKMWLVNRRRGQWVDPEKINRHVGNDERRDVALTAVDVIQAMLSDPEKASTFMKVIQRREIVEAKVIDVTSD